MQRQRNRGEAVRRAATAGVVLSAGILTLLGVVRAFGARAVLKEASSTFIVSDYIDGYVLYEDGTTPAYRVPVRLWDIESRRFIYRTDTDRDGYFSIPVEQIGRYYLVFDWTRLKIEAVEPEQQLVQRTHVITILPRPVGAVTMPHLVTILGASSMSEVVSRFEKPRPKIVSP